MTDLKSPQEGDMRVYGTLGYTPVVGLPLEFDPKPPRVDRDGHNGWSRRQEAAWERIFAPRTPHARVGARPETVSSVLRRPR